MLTLAAALAMPPHARVNTKCHTQWRDDQAGLAVVWGGRAWTDEALFARALDTAPDRRDDTCVGERCVQRLWCADSGVAGRYWAYAGARDDVRLRAVWLEDARTTYEGGLNATAADGRPLRSTSEYGPGTVAVHGDVLWYYSFDKESSARAPHGLPQLSALRFSAWRVGAAGKDLVTRLVDALDVLGYGDVYNWDASSSPLYPCGAGAVTVSVEQYVSVGASEWDDWAVDAVVALPGARGPLVHYERYEDPRTPSVSSPSREVVTAPGYTCRAHANKSVTCYEVGAGAHTWAAEALHWLGRDFAPLAGRRFTLRGLWLHAANDWFNDMSGLAPYTALVGWGMAPALAFTGSTAWAVVVDEADECAHGRLALARWDVAGEPVRVGATPLGCAPGALKVPAVHYHEPSYAATAVRWAGPWAGAFTLFVARDLARGEYAEHALAPRPVGPGTPSEPRVCAPGAEPHGGACVRCAAGAYSAGDACGPCPAGRQCAGRAVGMPCAAGTYSPAGALRCEPCAPGTFAAEGAGACTPCPPGTWSDAGAGACA